MNTAADNLFEILVAKTGLRRSGERMYGGIGFSPNSNLGITVKKKAVEVYFETYGGDKDLPAVELMDWANKSGLLREEVQPGVFFELKQGAKNKNKAALTTAIPYASEEELSSLADKIVELIELLAEKVAAIVTRKKVAIVFSDEQSKPVDDAVLAKVVSHLKKKLGDIIVDNAAEIETSESFKVRPGYGYDKFYLDQIDGSYDESLHSLIHYIMWEDELYHELLSAEQLKDVGNLIEDAPEAIYRPELNDEDAEKLSDILDGVYWQAITYVGKELTRFNFFDSSEFVDLGYSEETIEDDDPVSDEESEPDANGIDDLCHSLSERLMSEAFFGPLVKEGNVTNVKVEYDSMMTNFTVTLALDNDSIDELDLDEEDAINDALKAYFTKHGLWEKLSALGCKEEDCGGFTVLVAE